MKTKIIRKKILFIFLLIIPKLLSQENKFISIPFSFNYIKYFSNYNATNFFKDFFKKNLFLQFNIGTPLKEINSLIDQNSECFKFIKDKSDDYFSDNYRFYPFQSSSLYKENNPVIFSPFFEIYIDNFYFKGMNESLPLEFLLDNYTKLSNNSYLPVIGLSIPFLYTGIPCPNLISNLKKYGSIKKILWSLEYNQFGGNLVIGEELSVYDPIRYPESNYSTLYFDSKYIIKFDEISVKDKWPKTNSKKNRNQNFLKDILNITEAFINTNFGLIIGTSEYKKYIDDKIFNSLINKSICKIDIINYFSNNRNEKNFNNDYYVYSCYDKIFTGDIYPLHPSTNYYNYFPSLLLTSKKLEYNFELINKDLFEHILDRYYFLVIFKKNLDLKEKEIWHLGEPFYKKYSFTINPDAKTIGFYIEKDKNIIIKDRNINNNITDKDNINKEKNNIRIKLIKIIIEIIAVISISLSAYYIGLTVKERRKKRANELKDDNYEYLSEKDKNINKPPKDNNSQQFIELNSRLGI